jgi:hypothetical protein
LPSWNICPGVPSLVPTASRSTRKAWLAGTTPPMLATSMRKMRGLSEYPGVPALGRITRQRIQ